MIGVDSVNKVARCLHLCYGKNKFKCVSVYIDLNNLIIIEQSSNGANINMTEEPKQ